MNGPPNPKTLVAPIIATPLSDFEAWKANTWTPNTNINSYSTVFPAAESGYVDMSPEEMIWVQPLAGPDSWTLDEPTPINSNYGIERMPQLGKTVRFGSPSGDFQLYNQRTVNYEDPEDPLNSQYIRLGHEIRKEIEDERRAAAYNYPPNPEEVYDPRFYGYGTQYRTYVDNLNGQPRYYYDDIDAARQERNIVRNNIYYPNQGGSNDAKIYAQRSFIENTDNSRLDLQQKLLRKRNAELWQQRLAPQLSARFSNSSFRN